jgi:hypothetical protein
VVPFRDFDAAAGSIGWSNRDHPLLELTAPPRRFAASYRGYWFAIPLRRQPFPRPCGFPHAATNVRCNHTLGLGSSVFLQSLATTALAAPTSRGGASRGLSAPSAHVRPEDPLMRGGVPRRPRSAFRVWLPSGRFDPLRPERACTARSAPGICPFEA